MDEALTAYDEIIDFLARGSTSEEVIAFRPSEIAQARVRELLERNKTDEMTSEESLELQNFGELEHFMQLVKARAQSYVDRNSY